MSTGFVETLVMKLGGSLIVPNGGINSAYLQRFDVFIRKQVLENKRQFFLLIGGGALARQYRDAGAAVTSHHITNEDLDWLGVHATRLNAHLLRTIFRDIAHPIILKDYRFLQKPTQPIVIAAGWKPGWSTDYLAVLLARDYHIPMIVKMSNTDYIYDKDPKQYLQAQPLEAISWTDYRAIVGDRWIPGSSMPFDPISSKLASELNVKVIYLNGMHLDNLEKALDGERFVGTTIA